MHVARGSVALAVLTLGGVAACGARTELLGPDTVDVVQLPDGGEARICGTLPTAGLPGEYNATLCTDPTHCDELGGAMVCPCAGAASPQICGFEAIHEDGHIFTAQCDPATGECQCIVDGNACACRAATNPVGLCTLGSPLNCCF